MGINEREKESTGSRPARKGPQIFDRTTVKDVETEGEGMRGCSGLTGEEAFAKFRVAEVSGGCSGILEAVELCSGGATGCGGLGDDVPDPMTGLAAGAHFGEGGGESGVGGGLGFFEAVERVYTVSTYP